MIIPGVVASSKNNTGGGTGSPTPIPTPSDYVGSTFTSSSSQVISVQGYTAFGGGGPAVATSPIVASWQPSTTTGVTGYQATITYTDVNGNVQTVTFNPTGTSISYVPANLSVNGTYTVTVAAVTANGVTGQPATQNITTTFGYGSGESSNTSANTTTYIPPYTYSQAQSASIQQSLLPTPVLGPAPGA